MDILKWSLLVSLAVCLTLGLMGCSSTPDPKDSEDSPFGPFQEKANEIIDAGGMAAVGIAESKSIHVAMTKAKERGRTEIVHSVESKIDSLRKDFIEEIGEGQGAEVNALFSSVSKNLASRELKGSVAKDVKYFTKDGITTAYALMIQDPKIVLDILEEEKNTNAHIYTRFRAAEAFKELNTEVEKYEENEKKLLQEFQSGS
jgi:hypothetical protein